ncbi:hypothetical protein [Aestuariivirga sp.]|uniref:hypothetical protein n=1 Tax=Aestuariivirga sp. TaxID=2650926 RepID=UPI003592F61E
MGAGRTFGFGVLGFVLGAIAGGVLGLLGGLGYTTLAETSGFEGYSGFVVVYWIIGGIVLGAVAGAAFGARRAGA